MRRVVSVLVALAASVGPAGAAAVCTGPIRVAVVTPTTTALALLGIQAANGVRFAADEINAAGGIAGQQVSVTVEDTAAAAGTALSAINRVLEPASDGSGPIAVFGSPISPLVFTQSEAIRKAGVPFLVTATNAGITAQNLPWLFRIHVHDGQLATLVPAYAVQTMHLQKPGIIVVGDDYGLGASKGMQATLAAMGITPAAATSYAPSDRDMTAQLLDITDKGADGIITFGRPGDLALVLKQIRQLGISLPRLGNTSLMAPTTMANVTDDEADGAIGIGGMLPQSGDARAQAFAAAVEAKYSVPADNFTVAYDDGMHLLKEAIEAVGCDRAAIRDRLAATSGWQGLLIRYTADARGDLAHTLGVYRNHGRSPQLLGTVSEAGF